MLSIQVRRCASAGCALLLIALGAGGCARGLNPNVHPPRTAKQKREVPCDTAINVDITTGGVDLGAAFLCENDNVTWQLPNTPTKHTFHVQFANGSPFVGNKTDFTDQDPSGKVKGQYSKLEVYKYTITVDQLNPVDPQVVGGGNP